MEGLIQRPERQSDYQATLQAFTNSCMFESYMALT